MRGLEAVRRIHRASGAWPLVAIAALAAVLTFAARPSSAGTSPSQPVWLAVLVALPAPHPTRTRIVEHLRMLPGDHLRSIARTLRISLGEARYHLHVMRRSGLVREENVRHRARFYALDPETQAERNVLYRKHWEHRDVRARVLQAVRTHGAVRPAQLAKTMGISRQLATYHLGHLASSGKLAREGSAYCLPPGLEDGHQPASTSVFDREFQA